MIDGEKVTIYALCDDSGVRYVGQTRQELARRLVGHVNEARRGTSPKDKWFRAVLASGTMPTIRELVGTDEAGANAAERDQIVRLRAQGAVLLNDRSRSRSHGPRRRARVAYRSYVATFPSDWRARVEQVAEDQGVPVAIMLRLLVHAGLERWESWMASRAAQQHGP